MRRLAHDQLTAIGGPVHGRTLPILASSDTLIIAEPVPLGLSADDPSTPPDWATRQTSYRRVRAAIGEPVSWFFDVLVADGCRIDNVSLRLADVVAAGCVTLLSGRYCPGPTVTDCVMWGHDPGSSYGRRRAPLERTEPLGILSPDTWSAAEWADLCWRCDAVSSTTDVGLCDPCLTDLRGEAA